MPEIVELGFPISKREDLDYQIVIPSRRRTDKVKKMLQIFPQAHVWVHKDDRQDYLKVVPEQQLRIHEVVGFSNIRAEMILGEKANCVVMFDDDTIGVACCQSEKTKKTFDPHFMRALVQNQIQLCYDLDIKLFGWNKNPNPTFYSSIRPFSFVAVPIGVWGVIGKDILPDRRLKWYGQDMDMAMQNLLKNRIVLTDNRFVFISNDVVGGNPGGAQGMRTSKDCQADYKLLKKKWGRYVICGVNAKAKAQAQSVNSFKINVSRRSSIIKED